MDNFNLNSQLFEDNLSLFEKIDSLTAYRIRFSSVDHLQFCETKKGELNIFRQRYGITDYYHSQEGAKDEADHLLRPDVLEYSPLLFFYGLGLAYSYDALKTWLREDPNRHLVYVEDDLEVISCFLYTERATELLQDPQVKLFHFKQWGDQRAYYLHSCFLKDRIRFLTLSYYYRRREEDATRLCYQILYNHVFVGNMHKEYLSGQSGFLKNFFSHLLRLSDSYLGNGLFDQFKNVPAIICGAGPSLEKNVDLLKQLSNRALIFAGGSSLNVLSAHGVIPHFGLGIDPNLEQYHRLMTTHVFHIPAFYRFRLFFEAFQLMQGPHLYVAGSANQLASWVEHTLGIKFPLIDEGHNVVHFCTEIAKAMGCNPIIYVGMDLAFTEVKTYATGIGQHPLWLGKSSPYNPEKESVAARDIHGEKIQTKWDWLLEAIWLGQYAQRYPALKMINASEGGLGFPPVPNLSLQEVIDKTLIYSEDLINRVHAEIQQNKLSISRHQLLTMVHDLRKSFEECLKDCTLIFKELARSTEIHSPLYPYSSQTILLESELQEETTYSAFLQIFDQAQLYLEEARLYLDPHRDDPHLHHTNLMNRYKFLSAVLMQTIKLLKEAMKQFVFDPPPLDIVDPSKAQISDRREENVYQFDGHLIHIEDTELSLHIQESFEPGPEDIKEEFYPSGQLKKRTFYFQGQLHGPSYFYSPEGILLAEGWFLHGKRQGKNWQYYSSGRLYSLQRYRNDSFHGTQEFFFENGQIHLILPYKNGLLNGTVHIYNSEGKPQRMLDYQNGKRHGVERNWGNNGHLLIECEYRDGVPLSAHEWDPNGHLRKEIQVHAFPDDFNISFWDEKGKLIHSVLHGIEDYSPYYLRTEGQADFLEGSVQILVKHVDQLLKDDEQKELVKQHPELLAELEGIKKNIENLESMRNELKHMMKNHLDKADEERSKRHPEGPIHE